MAYLPADILDIHPHPSNIFFIAASEPRHYLTLVSKGKKELGFQQFDSQ